MLDRTSAPYGLGTISSVLGHLFALYLVLFHLKPLPYQDEPEIYSVTIESGKSLGGITQVPDKVDTQTAPPVQVKAEDPVLEKQPQNVVVPEPDAEVSLATPQPTSTPVATPTAAPTPKATPKATATPKPSATPKKVEEKKPKETAGDINKDYAALLQRYRGASTDAGGKNFGAARTGGTGFGGGVIRPPEFFRYSELLRNLVKKGWRWNDNSADLIAVVGFSVAPDGRVSNISLLKSSGNSAYDMTAQRAVAKADPLPPPPQTVYQYFREVKMTFDPRER